MNLFDKQLHVKLEERKSKGILRKLKNYDGLVDFSSNDFLGLASQNQSGATGSRLISGNFVELEHLESSFAEKLGAKAALYYNSGYMANIGVIPVISDRSTTIFSDELIHASLRDGIRLSHAKHHVFPHNDLKKLGKTLAETDGKKIIVVESVYSMDGDSPDLTLLFDLAKQFDAGVLIDEAHGMGLSGKYNLGQAQQFIHHPNCIAVVYPLGKSAGLSGAFVVGSEVLKQYLINFSRSFIYTTAPSKKLIEQLKGQLANLYSKDISVIEKLKNQFILSINPHYSFITGDYSAVVGLLTGEKTLEIEAELLKQNLFVKAILAPTVKKGKERIRICFHDFNTLNEIKFLVNILNNMV